MADNKSFAGTEVDHGSVQKDKNSYPLELVQRQVLKHLLKED
jgi:hypothetical protein